MSDDIRAAAERLLKRATWNVQGFGLNNVSTQCLDILAVAKYALAQQSDAARLEEAEACPSCGEVMCLPITICTKMAQVTTMPNVHAAAGGFAIQALIDTVRTGGEVSIPSLGVALTAANLGALVVAPTPAPDPRDAELERLREALQTELDHAEQSIRDRTEGMSEDRQAYYMEGTPRVRRLRAALTASAAADAAAAQPPGRVRGR